MHLYNSGPYYEISERSILYVTDRSGTNQNAAFCRWTAFPYNNIPYERSTDSSMQYTLPESIRHFGYIIGSPFRACDFTITCQSRKRGSIAKVTYFPEALQN